MADNKRTGERGIWRFRINRLTDKLRGLVDSVTNGDRRPAIEKRSISYPTLSQTSVFAEPLGEQRSAQSSRSADDVATVYTRASQIVGHQPASVVRESVGEQRPARSSHKADDAAAIYFSAREIADYRPNSVASESLGSLPPTYDEATAAARHETPRSPLIADGGRPESVEIPIALDVPEHHPVARSDGVPRLPDVEADTSPLFPKDEFDRTFDKARVDAVAKAAIQVPVRVDTSPLFPKGEFDRTFDNARANAVGEPPKLQIRDRSRGAAVR